MSRPSAFLVVLLAGFLILMGAGPRTEANRLLRDAYAAFVHGELSHAAALYGRAEERTTDPALIAFDLAGVQYRLALATGDPGLLAEAEQNYRCCLEPSDPRRAAALYGLGNCLLARAAGRNVPVLGEALAAYDSCLSEVEPPDLVASAASYNREKARLLLIQARAAQASAPDTPPQGSSPDSRPPDRAFAPESPALEPGERAPGDPQAVGKPSPLKGEDGKNARDSSQPPPPGKSTLPPIPEDDQALPLTPREAATHLLQASVRIRAERRQALRARASRAPPAGVRDW